MDPNSKIKYNAICLSGGGPRGIVELGVLHNYWDEGYISYETTEAYAGTSIGACICLLLSIGYTPIEIFQKVCSISSFLEGSSLSGTPTSAETLNLFTNKGLINIENLTIHVKDMVLAKYRKLVKNTKLMIVPTLEELYQLTKKELFIVSSNIDTMEEEVFCYKSHPKLSCISAIGASCNIPFMFTENKINKCTFIDGGFSNNCPVRELKTSSTDSKRKILAITMTSINITGFDNTLHAYALRCMLFSIHNIQNLKLREVYQDPNIEFHIVNVPIKKYKGFNFKISYEEKMEMFSMGFSYANISHVDKYLFIDI